jgi:short-subunit dehydrogenase
LGKQNAVWITGASSGIGKALAIKFAKNNHKVVGSSRRSEIVEKLNLDYQFEYNIHSCKNDISKFDEVKNLFLELNEKYNINCLINNAGITSFKPFTENSHEDIEQIIDTNLKGSIYTCKVVLPEMILKNDGIIFNILSVAANTVFANSSIYAASKAGLAAFAKGLREELREHNIRIINIYPGATSTEIWPQKTIQKYSEKMMTPDNLANLIYDIYSNSHLLSPEEIVIRPITGDL